MIVVVSVLLILTPNLWDVNKEFISQGKEKIRVSCRRIKWLQALWSGRVRTGSVGNKLPTPGVWHFWGNSAELNPASPGTSTTASSCHPRESGDPRTKDWIPAFAGMAAFLHYPLSLLLQIPIPFNYQQESLKKFPCVFFQVYWAFLPI